MSTFESGKDVVPRRILFFLSSMTCGGAERVALLLSSALLDLGCDVIVVLARGEGEFLALLPSRVKVVSLECGRPINGIRRFGSVIHQLDPDVIVSFGMHVGVAAALSKKICGFRQPLLVRNESHIAVEWARERFHNRLLGPLLSRWMARSSTIVCVSHSLRVPTAEFLRITPERIEVVLNPVFPLAAPANEAMLHPWLARKTCPTFIAMGRLELQKDFRTLLGAFRRVLDEVDCRLVIFGEGSLRRSLSEQCADLRLGESVELAGVTESPSLQMRHATGFVLSSCWEGFGLVLVEALAAGTEVISTDCDYGPSELLQGGRFGTLVPVSNEAALAVAMVRLAWGGVAESKPSSEWYAQFDASVAARQHLEIIERVIAG